MKFIVFPSRTQDNPKFSNVYMIINSQLIFTWKRSGLLSKVGAFVFVNCK